MQAISNGVCPKCIEKCSKRPEQKDENKCFSCNQGSPQLIVDMQAICFKCYLNSLYPCKKQQSIQASFLSNKSFKAVEKKKVLNSSFLSSTGRMIKKIQKLFARLEEKPTDFINCLNKISLCSNPIDWQKLRTRCEGQSSLLYVFMSAKIVVGCYHTESSKMLGSIHKDTQSGFFITERNPVDLNFFKADKEQFCYIPQTKSLCLGSPVSFKISFQPQIIIKSELVDPNTQWKHYCVCKL